MVGLSWTVESVTHEMTRTPSYIALVCFVPTHEKGSVHGCVCYGPVSGTLRLPNSKKKLHTGNKQALGCMYNYEQLNTRVFAPPEYDSLERVNNAYNHVLAHVIRVYHVRTGNLYLSDRCKSAA